MPPQDMREGVNNAVTIFREVIYILTHSFSNVFLNILFFHTNFQGVSDTAHTICNVTAIEHDQKGVTGAVGAVLRQIPPTMVRPIVLATQATSNVLGGVCNQLLPDARRDAREKWKDDDE